MNLNHSKTQLLCIHANATSNVQSYVRSGSDKIVSTDKLNILGFMFGKELSVRAHINYMLDKAKKKLWTLRHLKRADLGKGDLLNIFLSVIRSVLEYAAPTYHSMLNIQMSDEIDGVQRRACKIIFGWDSSYSQLVEDGTIEELSKRREKNSFKFCYEDRKKRNIQGVVPVRSPSL